MVTNGEPARVLAVIGGLAIAAGACGESGGAGQPQPCPQGSAGATGAAGGGGAVPSGPCSVPGDCPGEDSVCKYQTCTGHTCGLADAPAGTGCEGGGMCDGHGACIYKGNGYPCAGAADCLSGNCADGVCCDKACAGLCEACVAAKSGGASGTCGFALSGTDPDGECGPDTCNGNGLCRCTDSVQNGDESDVDCGGAACPKCAAGKKCAAPADCASGFCPPGDGVCCKSACAGPCEACNLPENEAVCALHAAGTDPELECAPGSCDGSGACAAGQHKWSQAYGDSSKQEARAVVADGSGNVVVAGHFYGTLKLGGDTLASEGNDDIFVAKLDQDGVPQWSKAAGDSSSQEARAVATDSSGNVLIAGFFGGSVNFGGQHLPSQGGNDIFVAKLGKDGKHLWSKSFGDQGDQRAESVAAAGAGDVLVTGTFVGGLSFGGQYLQAQYYPDIFLVRFDKDGKHVWSKSFDLGYKPGDVRGVAVDPVGNVLVAGSFGGSLSFSGGGDVLTSKGESDIFVAKLDKDGNHVWSKRFGDAQQQYGLGVATDGAGNVVVTGNFDGTVSFGGQDLTSSGGDVFVAKLDPDGNHLWSKRFGDASYQQAGAVAADDAGNVFVAASFAGAVNLGGKDLQSAGGYDIVVAKLNPAGIHLWSRRFGDAKSQYARSIATDGAGSAIIAGQLDGTVNFGGNDLACAGGGDAFLAKLGP
ncbi:MAG: hypothetical protein HY744_00570 [Deltaproteobacteria bacterium]|nr:hypothetical protein [Deltaproteobacteria bacterium]